MNVNWYGDPVVTDTIYYGTPVIDDGSKYAQLCFGTKFIVSYVYSMKTDNFFLNSF